MVCIHTIVNIQYTIMANMDSKFSPDFALTTIIKISIMLINWCTHFLSEVRVDT